MSDALSNAETARRAASPGDDGTGERYDVAIIGAGFAGIGMAAKLKQSGVQRIVILERGEGVGGTWRDNHYPGCACDIPSHLYSFSFLQNPDWSRLYPPQQEIREYLEDAVQVFDLEDCVRLSTTVTEARWIEEHGAWRLQDRAGRRLFATCVVSAIGGLSRPAWPDIEGIESFGGELFHTADWHDDLNLEGKRVAVIGTGASAIQLVPQIAPEVAKLYLFQRTPPWIVPKPDRPMRGWEQRLFRRFPLSLKAFRMFLYWRQEVLGLGFTLTSRLMSRGTKMAKDHIRASIADPELRERVTPDYQIGCKRVLLSDDYYPALERGNVELVGEGVTRLTPTSVVSAGGAFDVDVIICATGFDAVNPLPPLRIFGRGGREIADDWRDAPEAFLGISVAGYPNLFILMGPNTGLGHNSVVFMIEAQIRYVTRMIRRIMEQPGTVLDVRPEVQASFNRRLKGRFRNTVWASGCKSWYQAANGQQVAIWPGFTFTYWFRTLRPDFGQYDASTGR